MVARIITKSKNVDTFNFITITESMDDINPNVPTLIIGKERALSIYPKEKIHIRNRNIEGKVWWTYARSEKRDEYEMDLENFNRYVVEDLSKSVKYTSFNIITSPFSRVKDMICFMNSDEIKHVYVTDKQIYIYSKGVVFGISKDEIRYCNVNVDKTIGKLYKNKSVKMVDGRNYGWKEVKKMNSRAIFIIPYIDFLKNDSVFSKNNLFMEY